MSNNNILYNNALNIVFSILILSLIILCVELMIENSKLNSESNELIEQMKDTATSGINRAMSVLFGDGNGDGTPTISIKFYVPDFDNCVVFFTVN